MDLIKEKMIKSIVRRGTSDGTFQRAKIYSKNYSGYVHSKKRSEFRTYLFEELDKHMPLITQNTDDKVHYELISQFCDRISNGVYKDLLSEGRFRTGTGQKLINLYWKMSWLLLPNYPRPIHCPFDFVIIKKLGNSVKHIKWTSFDDYDTYEKLVDAAKIAAKEYDCIADWEMVIYYDSVLS